MQFAICVEVVWRPGARWPLQRAARKVRNADEMAEFIYEQLASIEGVARGKKLEGALECYIQAAIWNVHKDKDCGAIMERFEREGDVAMSVGHLSTFSVAAADTLMGRLAQAGRAEIVVVADERASHERN